MAKVGLYSFYEDCGRNGDLDYLFFTTDEEVGKADGKTAYLGEVLGKHSDVSVVIELGDNLRLVTDDEEELKVLQKYSGYLTVGRNVVGCALGEEE